MKPSELEFKPLHHEPYLQICEILFDSKHIGIERAVFPVAAVNPYAFAIYQHLRDDLTKPYGAEPIGDAPLIVSPEDDPSHVGFMIPGWTTIKLFIQSFIDYPITEPAP